MKPGHSNPWVAYRGFPSFHLGLVFTLALALACMGASKGMVGAASGASIPRLVVLDPMDLSDNQPKPDVGRILRSALPVGAWSTLSRDSVARKLREFGQNPDLACNSTQCAFDVGNITQVEFVLFGTCTGFGRVDALTLKLLHIPTAQVVWVRAFESPAGYAMIRDQNLAATYEKTLADLKPKALDLAKPSSKKFLAVIDLSENPQSAKVFFERVGTRIYGVRRYDLMAPAELNELLTALEINKYSVVPSVENMVGLGQKLGVGYLLYSRLYRDGKSHVYRLAFYDVTAKRLVLELPPQPSEDDAKLLDYERIFFNTLAERDKHVEKPVVQDKTPKKPFNKALWISLGVLGVGGGLAALWVESWKEPGKNPEPVDIFGRPMDPPQDPND